MFSAIKGIFWNKRLLIVAAGLGCCWQERTVDGGVETGRLDKDTGHFCRGTALAVTNTVNFLTVIELDFICFLAVPGLQCDVKLLKTVNHWFNSSVVVWATSNQDI